MKQILINSEELQVRVAVVNDGTLEDFFMERTNRDRIVGSIYKGRIKNLEPSLQAAFVDIGVGKNAFLHYWDMLPATQEMLEGGDDDDDDDDAPKGGASEVRHEHRCECGDHEDDECPEAADDSGESGSSASASASAAEDGADGASAPEEPIPFLPATSTSNGDGDRRNGRSNGSAASSHAAPAPSANPSLVPLTKCTGIVPLARKSEAPAAAASSEPEQQQAEASATAPIEAAAPVTETAELPENPSPLQQQMQQPQQQREPRENGGNGGNGGNGRGERGPRNNGGSQQQQQRGGNQQRNQQQRNSEAVGEQPQQSAAAAAQNGGSRRRRRRGRGGNGGAAAVEPPKPGFFQRLFQALLPSLFKKKPEGSGSRISTAGSAPAGQLVPLTSGGSQPTSKNGKSGQQPSQQNGQGGTQQNSAAAGQLVPLQEKGNKGGKQQQQPKRQEKKGPTTEDIPNLFHVDQEILVQVTKGPIGTKGARVTTNLSIPGRNLVLLPNCSHVGVSRRVDDHEERSRLKQMVKTLELPPNMGVICRTAGAGLKREIFQRDLDMLLDAWHKGEETAAKRKAPVCIYQEPALEERVLRDCLTQDIDEIVVDTKEAYDHAAAMLARFERQNEVKLKLHNSPTPIFIKYGISQQIENISNRKVMLPSGGYLCIDETEALIAIDVNTGKNRSGKDQPETILATNMEAVKEIARQLRLRNIGGLVVLDLIDMRSRKDQMAVFRAFKQYTSEDHARIKIYPISGLGLLEMSRQRETESLESTIFEDCPYCKGRGLIKTPTTISVEIQRRLNELLARKRDVEHLIVTVHPKVMERLKTADHRIMDALAAEYHRQLTFSSNSELHIEEYHIADKATGKAFC